MVDRLRLSTGPQVTWDFGYSTSWSLNLSNIGHLQELDTEKRIEKFASEKGPSSSRDLIPPVNLENLALSNEKNLKAGHETLPMTFASTTRLFSPWFLEHYPYLIMIENWADKS